MFLNLINPNDENAYDLLSWAFEKYTLSIIPAEVAGAVTQKKKVPPNFTPLNDFVTSLSNHFRSSSALVRYGACIFLHMALSLSSTLLQENTHVFIFIATGLLDTDYLSAFLYLTMAESMTGPDSAQIKELVAKYRHLGILTRVDSKNQDSSETLYKILGIVVKSSPPLATKLLQKMASSLEYLSKPMKLKQLELICVWGSKSEKVFFDGRDLIHSLICISCRLWFL